MTEKTKQKTLSPAYVTTPPVRVSFPSLDKARQRAPGSDRLTFQAVLLLPPETDLKPFQEAMRYAIVEKFGKPIQLPRDKNPIKDCADKVSVSGYEEGWHFINTHSGYQPKVVDHRREPIIDIAGTIYPGCWCRFLIKAFAYDHKVGGKGVSFSLEAVQFHHDDERLDGRADAKDVFDPIESDEAPASNNTASDADIWG